MTMRWIWLVPSKICMTFTSSVYRHLPDCSEAGQRWNVALVGHFRAD